MLNDRAHISDQELLMAADGELPARRRGQVKTHLDSCWTCRERMRTFDEAIVDLIRARNHELDGQIPPVAGSRALLRARMAQVADSSRVSRPIWRMAAIVAACTFVLTLAALALLRIRSEAEGPRPDARLTPGDTRPITLQETCSSAEAEVVVRDIPDDTRRQVFAAYNISPAQSRDFEVDYLITPDLGGANSVRNLWPQPYSARWNAKVKDRLEQRLHDLVCQGKVDLATAQRDLASDWIVAYKKYVPHPALRRRWPDTSRRQSEETIMTADARY